MTAPEGTDLTGLVDDMGLVAWEADVASQRNRFLGALERRSQGWMTPSGSW